MRCATTLILRWIALSLFLLATPLWAQETGDGEQLDFATWEATATRAESIIEDAEASSPALETLRATLVAYRAQALVLQDVNKARIDTLKSQIAALGPVPEAPIIEAPEVAERRVKLNDQLALTRAPVLEAQEAYKRADGLIGEVDRIIRERLSEQFFTLGDSPLNLTLWPGAFDALSGFVTGIGDEVKRGLSSDAQWVMIQQNIPITLGLFLIGLVLLTRARHWLLKGLGLVPKSQDRNENEARVLLVSTTQVILPMVGINLIVQAFYTTTLVGLHGGVLLGAVPWMGLAVFATIWLGQTLFSQNRDMPQFFDLSVLNQTRGRRISTSMGVVLALGLLLDRIAAQTDFPESAYIVLSFPIVIAAGALLVRMGLILDPRNMTAETKVDENPLQIRLYGLITRGAIVLGAVGPVLAAIGYFTASTSFVFPAIKTLALFGIIVVLYRTLTDLADALLRSARGQGDDGAEDRPQTMIPVALGFGLILIAVPLLALIWGARVSDLLEIWTLISDGFTVGDRRISASDFLTFALIFAAGYTITRLLQSTLRTTVLPRTTLDSGGRNAILTGTGYVGIFLAALAAITAAGFDLSSVAIVAGALSVGIGFGLQAIVSNFVSGIILLVERPIKEGDWIEVGAYSGYVRKISVRATEIETFDRSTVVVPNADFISGTVTNYTHGNLNGRVVIPVGVAYDSDPVRVREILHEIGEANPMVDHRYNISIYLQGFGADSMDFDMRLILKDVNYVMSVKSEVNFEIVRRFREEGIEIPYPQRDLHLRNLKELGETLKDSIGPKS